MEKIRSGQSYLYKTNGLNSTLFEVRMVDNVRGDLLRRALETTYMRYPYFKSKLVEKDGDFYLEKNDLSFAFAKTEKYRSLGSLAVNYHLIDVTYSKQNIRIAFHHALCDGRGIKPFIETLIYYYCSLRYNQTFNPEGIRLFDSPLLPGETEEPSLKHFEIDPNAELPQIVKDGYHLEEIDENPLDHTLRYEIKINYDDFIHTAIENNATPAILLSLIASNAIHQVHPDHEKPVVCNMAADLRHTLGFDNTHKNCVNSVYLAYDQAFHLLPLNEKASTFRASIKSQRDPNLIKTHFNHMVMLSDKLDTQKTLQSKKQMLSFFNDLCVDSYIISYVGQFNLGDWEKHVDSIHLYSSGNKGLIFNMTAAGQYFTIDMLQSFESDAYVDALTATLNELKINYDLSEVIPFETRADRTQKTGKWQSERFYKFK